MPEDEQQRFLQSLTPDEARYLDWDWSFWGRPQQLQPTWDWRIWLLLAGRGFGKTRTGAEFIREEVEAGRAERIALVGATAADVRDVMITGPAGIMAVCPPWFMPKYEPSKRRLTWPNGAIATCYSADKPARLRGPNHDLAWADELAAWRYPESFDQLMLTMRHGDNPRTVITTTPRPIPMVRELLKRRHDLDEGIIGDRDVHVTRGTTYENAENLASQFLRDIIRQYEGTNLGRQELLAQVLDEIEGALWSLAQLDQLRVKRRPSNLVRVGVAVDPSATSSETSDETGIVVVGKDQDDIGYVLEDYSGRYTPADWARKVLRAVRDHQADFIAVEVNQGGEMVVHTLRSMLVPGEVLPRIIEVHASKGKFARAEPISALYEQRRIRHIGTLAKLEDQMCTWVPGDSKKSPDRVDALVWGMTALFPNVAGGPFAAKAAAATRDIRSGMYGGSAPNVNNWRQQLLVIRKRLLVMQQRDVRRTARSLRLAA